MAFEDNDGAPRDDYINGFIDGTENIIGTKSIIQTNRPDKQIYSEYSASFNKNEVIATMMSSEWFVIHTHGVYAGFQIGPLGASLSMYDLEQKDLSNLKFALLLTCETGEGFDPSHITNNDPRNIIERMVCQGAETVVGFSENTYVSDCNRFAPAFFQKTLVEGKNVQKAIEELDDYWTPNQITDFAVIAGNEYQYLS